MKINLGLISLLVFVPFVMGVTEPPGEDPPNADKNQTSKDGALHKDERLLLPPLGIGAFFSTTTMFSVVTHTTSSFMTCLSTTITTTCTGRRKRRALIKQFNVDDSIEEEGQLDGSHNSGHEALIRPVEKIDRRTGRQFTVWSTHFSTLTVVLTNTIPGTTFTVSALCMSIGGSAVSQGCFLG